MDEQEKYIIPAYNIIKIKVIESFYACNSFLKAFRQIPSKKDINASDKEQKGLFWISFASELISLYSLLRTTLRKNNKTQVAYKELKILEKYQLEIGKLSYSEGIKLYNILEGALFDIGILDITLDKEDATQAMR